MSEAPGARPILLACDRTRGVHDPRRRRRPMRHHAATGGHVASQTTYAQRAVDEYIAGGRVQGVFQLKFSFYGFRYLEARRA